MANPQKENGYTAIANEIWEHLNMVRISGEAWQVLGVIFRHTYGFNKKEDMIALEQFSKKTGLKRPTVCRALSKLIIMNLIVIKKDNYITKYSFNKDFDSWKPLSKKIIPIIKKDNKPVSKKITNQSQKRYIQKKENKKDNITKERGSPAQNARQFFKGVNDLANKAESGDALATKIFLQGLEARYPDATKGLIWGEIRKFERYWTERNKLGTKERWEQQETFEVDRRLVTWFSKIKEFQNKVEIVSNKKKILL